MNRRTRDGPVPMVFARLDAADRQSLLDRDVEVGKLALLLGGDGPAHTGDLAGQVDRWRHDDQRDEQRPASDRATMATAVATTVVRLEAMEWSGA